MRKRGWTGGLNLCSNVSFMEFDCSKVSFVGLHEYPGRKEYRRRSVYIGMISFPN